MTYAHDFVRLFESAGLNVAGPADDGRALHQDFEVDERGVMVGIHDPEHPSELSQRFVAALRSAGIKVKIIRFGLPGQPLLIDRNQPVYDFDLYVVE